jgi:hypothetical protein
MADATAHSGIAITAGPVMARSDPTTYFITNTFWRRLKSTRDAMCGMIREH